MAARNALSHYQRVAREEAPPLTARRAARESPALRRGRGRTLHHLSSWRDA
jgi:hypothetical protein